MPTSFSDLKKRVLGYLADPTSDPEFPVWFAVELGEVNNANDPELETAMHAVSRAFSEAEQGRYTRESLAVAVTDYLSQFEPPQEQTEARMRFYTLPLFAFGSQSASQVVRFSASGSNSVPSFEKTSRVDQEPKLPSGGPAVISVWDMTAARA
jgi:hypothetical protein